MYWWMGRSEICLFGWLTWKEDVDDQDGETKSPKRVRCLMDDTPECYLKDFFILAPPKFNIAAEKWWLEDEFPFRIAYF